MIEIEQRHHKEIKIESIFEEVLSLGYVGKFFNPSIQQFMNIEDFNVDLHQKNNDYYINNFLFFDKSKAIDEKLSEIEKNYKIWQHCLRCHFSVLHHFWRFRCRRKLDHRGNKRHFYQRDLLQRRTYGLKF